MSHRSSTIDPELDLALSAMPKALNGKLMDLTDIPALQRVMHELTVATAAAVPADDRVEIRTLHAGRADGSSLAIRLIRPTGVDEELPALL